METNCMGSLFLSRLYHNWLFFKPPANMFHTEISVNAKHQNKIEVKCHHYQMLVVLPNSTANLEQSFFKSSF